LSCLKTIAGFLNSQGGTLIIGVSDDGEPVGVPAIDQFPSEDKMNLHLVNILASRIGSQFMLYIHPRFEDFKASRVMAVECWPSKSPVFVKDGAVERFFIRAGASTAELPASQAQGYIKERFDL
jgi:predicted HTH transcriptional regulator